MKSTNRQIKCKICGVKIDRSSCDNKYMILTEVNARTIPVTNTRTYLCEDHALLVQSDILITRMKRDVAEAKRLRKKL